MRHSHSSECFDSRSRVTFKVQRPGAVEIRFVRLIRLGCGGSLGQAKNSEAREAGERAEIGGASLEWKPLFNLMRSGK
jgi:hypothetical protein